MFHPVSADHSNHRLAVAPQKGYPGVRNARLPGLRIDIRGKIRSLGQSRSVQYALSIPERALRSASALSAGVVREVVEVVLPKGTGSRIMHEPHQLFLSSLYAVRSASAKASISVSVL